MAITFPYVFSNITQIFGIDSAGPIGCIIFGLYLVIDDEQKINFDVTAKVLDTLWIILEPAMFVLIGCTHLVD